MYLYETGAIDISKKVEIVLTVLWDHIILFPKGPSFSPVNLPQTERWFCLFEQINRWIHHHVDSFIIIITVMINVIAASRIFFVLTCLLYWDCRGWLGVSPGPGEMGWPFWHWLPGDSWSCFSLRLFLGCSTAEGWYCGWWVILFRQCAQAWPFGRLGQRERGRRRLFSLLAGDGVSFVSLEPRGRSWAHCLARPARGFAASR